MPSLVQLEGAFSKSFLSLVEANLKQSAERNMYENDDNVLESTSRRVTFFVLLLRVEIMMLRYIQDDSIFFESGDCLT